MSFNAQTIEATIEGSVIAGRFVIEQLAGAGGVGVVYRARDLSTGARVALKITRPADDAQMGRFDREATALERLSHPNVVRHVAHGRSADGRPYLAMEWLEGQTLREHLASGPLLLGDALALFRKLAGAVAAVHAAGLVHRDLKPENIFLVGGDMGVRLIDFGLVLPGDEELRLTRGGALLGTPAYMAPEQVRGETRIDARADVFALGAVMFECLVGEPPIAGDSLFDLLARVLSTEPPRVALRRPDVPEALDALIAQMLAKEPHGRPREARVVEAALDAINEAPARVVEGGVVIERTLEAHLPCSPRLAFGLLSDTDRWNRIVRSPRTDYVKAPVDRGGPGELERVGLAELMGLPMRWLEIGEGVEGQGFHARRVFVEGPFREVGFITRFEAVTGGCAVTAIVQIDCAPGMAEGLAGGLVEHLAGRLAVYLRALESLLGRVDVAAIERDAAASGAALARRVLLASGPDALLWGRAPGVDESAMDFRGELLLRDGVTEPSLASRLVAFARQAPDDLLREVRPGELAAAWGVGPSQMLAALGAATKAGLFELRWQVACNNCRVATAEAAVLDEVGRSIHCRECGLEVTPDLSANVEAVFSLHPSIRRLERRFHCASSPSHRPHIFAMLQLSPGARRVVDVDAPGCGLVARVRAFGAAAPIAAVAGARASIEVSDGRVQATVGEGGAGRTMCVEIHNSTGHHVELLLERPAGLPVVSAIDAAATPGLADLLATQAPAEGVDLTVSSVSLLFTAFEGVDELCERDGDGRALSRLRSAQAVLRATVEATGGSLHRVEGDAAVALFSCPDDALAAARVLLAPEAPRPLALRASLFDGACLAVRSDARLEFFGRSLRAAALRLRHASPGQLACPPRLADHRALTGRFDVVGGVVDGALLLCPVSAAPSAP